MRLGLGERGCGFVWLVYCDVLFCCVCVCVLFIDWFLVFWLEVRGLWEVVLGVFGCDGYGGLGVGVVCGRGVLWDVGC